MSVPFSSKQLMDLRKDARQLADRASDHEAEIEALAASVRTSTRLAESALSRTRNLPFEELRDVLDAQLQWSVAAAAKANHLSVLAREQYDAAQRLLGRLNGSGHTIAPEHHLQQSQRSDAVLVVDDYDDVREMVSFALRNVGFIVRTAANGLEALIAAYEMRPAVIVMDVGMPVLDGIEATRLIKATNATRDARVIAHTGKALFDDGVSEALFAAVLRKPVTIDALLATVQHVAGL
jgi:two-component system, cell cycle response regulator DivK